MITKFKSIKGMAVFKDFDWDASVCEQGQPVPFKQVNIMYGRNYSGKTTLSRIVRAFETGNLSDKYGRPMFSVLLDNGKQLTEQDIQTSGLLIRVFNEDFIRENLQFVVDPHADVIPFAVLGEENTRIESEIDEIRAKLGVPTSGAETALYAARKTAFEAYKAACQSLDTANESLNKQKRKKATDQKVGIKYQVSRFNVQNYDIRNLNEDINTVLSDTFKHPSDEEIIAFETALTEQYKETAPSIGCPVLKITELAAACKEICERKVGTSEKIQELLRNVALEQWVKAGMIHNQGRKKCAFCGQPLQDSRWTELYRHFDEETEKLTKDIERFVKDLECEQSRIETAFAPDKSRFYATFIPALEALVETYETFKESYIKELGHLREWAEKRRNCIHEELPFSYAEPSFDIVEVFNKYKELQEKTNAYGKEIGAAKAYAQKILRYVEVERFLNEIDYPSQISTLAMLEKQKDNKKQVYDKIVEEISALEKNIEAKYRLLNDEEKGAQKVNEYLSTYFKHRYLSLQAVESADSDGKKIHFEVVRNGTKAFHLSEGECSLIAFCYFVAKLNDVDTTGKKPIIWIDDPISSLDGNHIYFVYSLITQEILAKDAYEQLFITTHNLQFLKYLRVLSINNHQKAAKGISRTNLLVERMGDCSRIVPMPKYLKEHGTEFNHWFECIYKCANMTTVNDNSVYLFESFGNNARKFLETYLYYRYPDKESFEKHLSRFFGETGIPPIIVRKVSDEMSHGDGDLENHNVPFDEPEVIDAAKILIKRLKTIDEDQYNALVSSIQ